MFSCLIRKKYQNEYNKGVPILLSSNDCENFLRLNDTKTIEKAKKLNWKKISK